VGRFEYDNEKMLSRCCKAEPLGDLDHGMLGICCECKNEAVFNLESEYDAEYFD